MCIDYPDKLQETHFVVKDTIRLGVHASLRRNCQQLTSDSTQMCSSSSCPTNWRRRDTGSKHQHSNHHNPRISTLTLLNEAYATVSYCLRYNNQFKSTICYQFGFSLPTKTSFLLIRENVANLPCFPLQVAFKAKRSHWQEMGGI